jgi:hypothetical protein
VLGGFTLVIPPLGTIMIELDEEKGQVKITGAHAIKESVPPGNMLLSIENRGARYDPPIEHLGQKLTATDPVTVAEKALAFYEDFLGQAETKFFPRSVR